VEVEASLREALVLALEREGGSGGGGGAGAGAGMRAGLVPLPSVLIHLRSTTLPEGIAKVSLGANSTGRGGKPDLSTTETDLGADGSASHFFGDVVGE